MDSDGEVNLALTGLTLRKYIVKRAISHCGRSNVSCCLRLPCSVRRYKQKRV